MTQTMTLDELREIFLSAPASDATRLVTVLLSVGLLAAVLLLVRRGVLREEFTPLWLGISVSLLVVSLKLEILQAVARLIGAWTASSTVFFLGLAGLGLICLHYAVRLSQTNLQLKNLAQEMALLRAEIDRGRSPRVGDHST